MIKVRLLGVDRLKKELEEKVAKESDKLVQRRVRQAVEGLRAETPRATGRAASSWKVRKEQSTQPGRDRPLRSLPTYYIENDTPYIEYLNRGSSRTPPRRFIERVLEHFGITVNPGDVTYTRDE